MKGLFGQVARFIESRIRLADLVLLRIGTRVAIRILQLLIVARYLDIWVFRKASFVSRIVVIGLRHDYCGWTREW